MPKEFTSKPQPLPSDEHQLMEHLHEVLRLLNRVSLTGLRADRTELFEYSQPEKIVRLVADVMIATARAIKRGQN